MSECDAVIAYRIIYRDGVEKEAGLDQVFGVSEAVLLPIPDGTSVVINFTATAPYGLSGISFPAQVLCNYYIWNSRVL